VSLGLTVERALLGDEVSGLLVIQDGSGVIGVSVSQAPTRQRFTIAHEIGHWVLHREKMPVFIDKHFLQPYFAAFRNAASATGTDRLEREANSFAAALLMPVPAIRSAVSQFDADVSDDEAVEALAERFQVSRQAMAFRLANVAGESEAPKR
jgi:Zn-dependent peptidase ImmA (M78 family)